MVSCTNVLSSAFEFTALRLYYSDTYRLPPKVIWGYRAYSKQRQSVAIRCTRQADNKMGLGFGNLYKLRRIVYFRISPYEQKPFVGMISEGIPNLIRRIDGCIFRFAPHMAVTYLVYAWGNEANHHLHRKDPKMFENDS